MNTINKFYLNKAEYQVEIGGVEVLLKLDYAGNGYRIEGEMSEEVERIAKMMLKKKHGVNFAYKFSDKIGES